MVILGVDLGDRRTGVAVSDPTAFLAGRARTLSHVGWEALFRLLLPIVEEEHPARIVVGLPLHMNGDEGPRAQSARAFAAQLEARSGVPVVLWDERCTSVTANRLLSDAGKKRQKQRAQVDAVAAVVILQSYLDAERERTRQNAE